jgi:hypothetical protein
MHHVVPKSKGGINTVPLCVDCHGKVHGRKMAHKDLIKDAINARLTAGKAGTTVPYGYVADAEGYLSECPTEMPILLRIVQMHEDKVPFFRIANTLNKEGIPTKRKGQWWATTIKNTLKSYNKYLHYVTDRTIINETIIPTRPGAARS